MFNCNDFKEKHHNKIKKLGYWSNPREIGTLLMLMVTEISKLYDIEKLNKSEKLADIALRIYDYCGYYNIDLAQLPTVSECSFLSMIKCITNEMESYRADIDLQGKYIKECLSMCYLYALENNISLESELMRKFEMLDFIKKKKC